MILLLVVVLLISYCIFLKLQKHKENFQMKDENDIIETSIFMYQHDALHNIIGVTKKTSSLYVFSNEEISTVAFSDIVKIYYLEDAVYPVINRICKMYGNAIKNTLLKIEYENILKLELSKYDILLVMCDPNDKKLELFHKLFYENKRLIKYKDIEFYFPLCSLKFLRLHIPYIIYTTGPFFPSTTNYEKILHLSNTKLLKKHYGINNNDDDNKQLSWKYTHENIVIEKENNIPFKYIMISFSTDQNVKLIDIVNKIKETTITAKFLKLGDKVELTHQLLSEDNGIYYVNKKLNENRYVINNMYMGLPMIINNQLKLSELSDNIYLFIGENIYQDDGIYSVEKIDEKLKVVYFTKHAQQQKPNEGKCIDENLVDIHKEYLNEYSCTSEVDEIGLKKNKHHWIVKCRSDSDCPYFMANKNYKNYYGKCENEYCQLPLGMKITDTFDIDTLLDNALCYGCLNDSNYTCCREQLNSNLYPHLSSPDYVYPKDTFVRYNNKNNNIINL